MKIMKKTVFALVLFCCLSMMAQAEVAKYCMTYTDYVAGNWKSVDELTQGRTKQACRLKSNNNQFYFRTGDKVADKMLKKEAFAVMYGDQLFVNCRNLRVNDCPLDISGYTQAVRYDNDKVCVMAYKNNDASFLLALGLDVASIFVDNKAVRIGMQIGAGGLWVGNEYLSRAVCYLVDSDANAKGKIATTRMNDKFMENLLNDDASLLEKYMAVNNKHNRQAASNVLPILMEKGLVVTKGIN